GVEMVAPDHDRTLERPLAHHAVEAPSEARALAEPQPADPGRQPLEAHVTLGERDPAMEALVARELLERRAVGGEDVLGISRERRPPERALAGTEQRADECGDETRIRE